MRQHAALLDAEFAQRSTAAWMTALAGKLPIAPLLGLAQALDNPHVRAVGLLQALAHTVDPALRVLANPIRLDGQRLPGRGCSPLGADTERLLGRAQSQSRG